MVEAMSPENIIKIQRDSDIKNIPLKLWDIYRIQGFVKIRKEFSGDNLHLEKKSIKKSKKNKSQKSGQ
jgi:hypothetical protein